MTAGTPALSPGASLRRVRTDLGMSRERLAALAGLTPRTIYAIEIEGVNPHRATRKVLALALGVKPAHLFPNEERPAVRPDVLAASAERGRHDEE
jgi:transcriptional regulator with XRE-family HTH domain